MSSNYYGDIAGEIADAGPGDDFDVPDHDPDDPDCGCDECDVDRQDEEG